MRQRRLTEDNSDAVTAATADNKVIDLASALKEAQDETKTYICTECGNDLVLDSSYKLKNPFGGEGYYCSNTNKCSLFAKVLDISVQKVKVKPRPVKGVISNLRDASQEVMIEFIQEDKGPGFEQDPYSRYDPEGDNNERMKLEGWHIVSSEIQLSDSSGQNRTIVKRTR